LEELPPKGIYMMPQVQKLPDIHEISKKGRKILEAISPELAKQHFGQFVAIEVDSGDYFIGETGIAATRKAQAKYPGKIFFLGRIGYRTAYSFKGRR
jgi:hypothetical protein